jgi:hypothetical protein
MRRPAELGSSVMWGLTILLAGLDGGLRARSVTGIVLDADESQHLHAAWLVGQGQVPYRDFWENHTPLLYCALAPLTRWLPDRPEIYTVGRIAMVLLTVGILVVTYRLGRRVGTHVAILAVVLLGVQSRFVIYTTQVRPDVPALLCWLLTLLAVVRWREEGRAVWLWMAGLGLGVGVTFTPKAVYGALGVAAVIVGAGCAEHIGVRRTLGALRRLLPGIAVPLLALVGWLWVVGGRAALDGFIADVVLGNLHFPDLTKQLPAMDEEWIVYVLGLVGLILTVRGHGRQVLRSAIHGPLVLTAGVISTILLVPSTPAVYPYTWLPVLAAASVYASISLSTVLRWARGQRAYLVGAGVTALVVAVVAIPLVASALGQRPQRYRAQIDRMRSMLTYACVGEPVLDGMALAVFRPAAYRYHVLVRGLASQIGHGVIAREGILADIRRAGAPIANPDRRLGVLGSPLDRLLATHYVPGPQGLLLAGARLALTGDRAEGSESVAMLTAGFYRLTAPDGVAVALDGTRVEPGLVWLERGDHTVGWRGSGGTISLVVTPCRERRARGQAP